MKLKRIPFDLTLANVNVTTKRVTDEHPSAKVTRNLDVVSVYDGDSNQLFTAHRTTKGYWRAWIAQ